jgi:putative PIN family toxin of toxin-antitoxin system
MITVFIDSSVLFAASLSTTGASAEIIRQGLRGEIAITVSDVVLEETRRNLSQLPRRSDEALAQLERFLTVTAFTQVEATKKQIERAAKYTVAKDAPIIAAAKKGKADYLVSLDRRHLVGVPEVAKRSRLRIVLPEELVKQLRK